MIAPIARRLALLGALLFALPARAEVIRSFDSVVRAQKDASLDVQETIVYDPQGEPHHGIERKIPVVYDRNGGTYSLHWKIKSITDENGARYHYSIIHSRRSVTFQIGDPDVLITGPHTYVIAMQYQRAVNWFDGAPEIYWNVTGNETAFTTERASARFYPPAGVDVSQLKSTAYQGALGSKQLAQQQTDADSLLFMADNLGPTQGLTFVVGLPAGSIEQPSTLQNLWWILRDWGSVVLFPLIALGVMLGLWRATGRDIEGGLPAQVEWSPPKDMTPAEVGTLINESCDMTDILSTLIDLAARGYLIIEELPASGGVMGIGAHKDYAFTRTNQQIPLDAPLKPHETTFLRGLFGDTSPSGRRVTLTSLKNNFYVYLPTIRDSIYRGLTQQRLFASNPDSTRKSYIGTGILIAGIGVLAFFGQQILGSISYGIGLMLAGGIVIAFSKAMPAKTALGSRRLRECVGFQRFVRLAEKDRIEKLITDDPTVFGRLLPYAMVLGVGEIWATKFADLMQTAPDWYVSSYGGPFQPYLFVNNLGSGMSEMGTTFASQPTQSSGAGGGSSGFSSGGGFSGGGFGGGGTGSW